MEAEEAGIEEAVEDGEKVVTRGESVDLKPCDSAKGWGRVDRCVSRMPEERRLGGT